MNWQVEQVLHFDKDRFREGRAHLGFHDSQGNQYALSYADHWVACLGSNGRPRWSAGSAVVPGTRLHIDCVLKNPTYITDTGDGSVLVASGGNRRVYRITPREKKPAFSLTETPGV